MNYVRLLTLCRYVISRLNLKHNLQLQYYIQYNAYLYTYFNAHNQSNILVIVEDVQIEVNVGMSMFSCIRCIDMFQQNYTYIILYYMHQQQLSASKKCYNCFCFLFFTIQCLRMLGLMAVTIGHITQGNQVNNHKILNKYNSLKCILLKIVLKFQINYSTNKQYV